MENPNCNKIKIFLSYLADLKERGYEIEIFYMTGEYRLKKIVDYGLCYDDQGLCEKVAKYDIICHSLVPNFLEHYSNQNNNTLYLDTSHLTIEGNQKVAELIIEKCSNK